MSDKRNKIYVYDNRCESFFRIHYETIKGNLII